jgi:hypothetical protein
MCGVLLDLIFFNSIGNKEMSKGLSQFFKLYKK